jgi:hypothetical protein
MVVFTDRCGLAALDAVARVPNVGGEEVVAESEIGTGGLHGSRVRLASGHDVPQHLKVPG